MVGKGVLLLFGAFLFVHSVASIEPTLNCTGVMANGRWAGKFVGVISKSEWVKINYLFKPLGNAPPLCVHIDDRIHPTRAHLLWDAFKSNARMEILVTGDHEVSGIKIQKRY